MARSAILLILSIICLAQQLVTAFPRPEADNEEAKPAEIDYRTLLQSSLLDTIALIQNHTSLILREEGQFVADLLAGVNEIPEKSAYIQEFISKLKSILERKEKLDLQDISPEVLNEKAAIITAIAEVFEDISRIALREDDSSETVMLKNVIYKLDLIGLNDRIKNSEKEAVQKFEVTCKRLLNSLGEQESKERKVLSEWFSNFQAKESDIKKYGSFVEFIRFVQALIIQNI
ncbi:uncharacterized protein LOC118736422 [Rhagoletis pomonella]|uniref:uncharacterized protein LOC118736422 n=1 Tax=Rhagoletis pomonella TaxID=28610 RepID=UPI001783E305|nr:uncharacterized protein LOC118736422 [Rhagoletis pomonella]